MTCHEARDFYSALVDGALDAGERAAVDGHLAGCAECRRELDRFRATVGLLRAAPVVRAPAGFVDRILEAARPTPWHRRLRERLFSPLRVKLPLEAAAVLLVAGIAVYVFQHTPELQRAARHEAPPAAPAAARPEGSAPGSFASPPVGSPPAPATVPPATSAPGPLASPPAGSRPAPVTAPPTAPVPRPLASPPAASAPAPATVPPAISAPGPIASPPAKSLPAPAEAPPPTSPAAPESVLAKRSAQPPASVGQMESERKAATPPAAGSNAADAGKSGVAMERSPADSAGPARERVLPSVLSDSQQRDRPGAPASREGQVAGAPAGSPPAASAPARPAPRATVKAAPDESAAGAGDRRLEAAPPGQGEQARVAPAAPATEIRGRLAVADREASLRGLDDLIARAGARALARRADGETAVVEILVPGGAYADFVQGLSRLGRFTADREPGAQPVQVRLTLRIGN